jgi:hypothetical protein
MKPKTLTLVVLSLVLVAGVALWRHRIKQSQSVPSAATRTDAARKQTFTFGKKSRAMPSAPVRTQSVTNFDLETLSPPVRLIVSAQEVFATRFASAKLAGAHLSPADQQALYAFLLERNPLDAQQEGQVLKNRVMDALCELNPPPAQLGDLLIQMYRDVSQDAVLRDYAIQHLAAYYEQLDQAAGMDPQAKHDEETKVQSILWEALSEVGSSISGTALLALTRLSEGRPEFDRNQIGATALQLAKEAVAGELTRITALEVCARLGVGDALPLLALAAQAGETMPVRIAAVGALGVLGGSDQTALLNELANSPEERLKVPALQALKQISKRERLAAQTQTKG